MKDNETIFVIGCSPDLARYEIWESLPNIMDNYTTIGINRFPIISRSKSLVNDDVEYEGLDRICDYWFFQDRCTIDMYLETFWKKNGEKEKIVTFEANIRDMKKPIIKPHQVKRYEWVCKPAIMLKPHHLPVKSFGTKLSGDRERKDGIPVTRCLQFRNSGLAATNLAFLLGAKNVVHVGIDITRTWNYPFNILPRRTVPVKSSNYVSSCNEMFKKLLEYGNIYKTNSENKLDLPYKSIVEFMK